MLIKVFFTALLSLSIPCFADSGIDKSKSSNSSSQSTQGSQSGSSATKKDSSTPQGSNQDKKPSMVDYCKKHTC